MTKPEVRLELLRLTYSHGRDASEAVERAKILEAFVLDDSVKPLGLPDKSAKPVPKHLAGTQAGR
jgi:hypothetical protein